MTRVDHPADFVDRHTGPSATEIASMLETLGCASLDELMDETVPASIRLEAPLDLPPALAESELLRRLKVIAERNEPFRSFLGMGYGDTITPGVIQRNILENPGWYTQYTPYQSEIAQGRLEALLNYQTAVIDLTGLPVANASLLDEATAAAEAMHISTGRARKGANVFFASNRCHPQTLAVLKTRAEPLGIRVVVGDHSRYVPTRSTAGVLVQYPATDGGIVDYREFVAAARAVGATVTVASDLLALTLLTPPGEWGADIVVGNSQRFGVPMGFGGPHAAFIAVADRLKRKMPGRIIGVSIDSQGKMALRMALQTREQHIRREKATSNICTAQVLLAIVAGAYAVYHGPEGLLRIARRTRALTAVLAKGLRDSGHEVLTEHHFDTLRIRPVGGADSVLDCARTARVNLRDFGDGTLGVSLDETTTAACVEVLIDVFLPGAGRAEPEGRDATTGRPAARDVAVPPLPEWARRTSSFLTHETFHKYRSETEMLRYLHRLETRDLSLNVSMIPLGSCTMKLNATSQMAPVAWPEFSAVHPCAPASQVRGYLELFRDLETWLAEITGFAATSLQPNSGAQGEYAGLLCIRAYHRDRGERERDVCLIPASAHGTNPASAMMAGLRVVVVDSAPDGTIDLADLRAKAEEHAERLAAIMVTYPSTHGVFEEDIREVCRTVHRNGGLVYLDGANLNAQVGLARPGDYGADVCHINLHKTFAIPHGGGGPGMGPICATRELAPFLPGHPVHDTGGVKAIGPVAAAAWGSASVLPISWTYIALLGAEGAKRASEVAILNANYMAERLAPHYPVLYRGAHGRVAHEFILDLRPLRRATGVTAEDVSKRLMDYGFHAPTVSFPVLGTLMIEPTESESKAELDRLVGALVAIRREIGGVESGKLPPDDNPLKNAPHTAEMATADEWTHPYSRTTAAYPAPWTRDFKFWPAASRVDNAFGDRFLQCSCPPLSSYRKP